MACSSRTGHNCYDNKPILVNITMRTTILEVLTILETTRLANIELKTIWCCHGKKISGAREYTVLLIVIYKALFCGISDDYVVISR